jgi:plasmid stabilization system protein ParE
VKWRVRVLKRAQNDLLAIQEYISRDNPTAADSWLRRFLALLGSLENFPNQGAVAKDRRLNRLGYRYLLHGDYVVFYEVFAKQVRVYRVLHGRRFYQHLL